MRWSVGVVLLYVRSTGYERLVVFCTVQYSVNEEKLLLVLWVTSNKREEQYY